jgi:hypothetical protein
MMTASSARLRRARVPVEIPRVASAAAGRIANAPRLPMPHAERKPSILPQVNMEVQGVPQLFSSCSSCAGEEQICCWICPWI